ncbi:MAG: SDR family oxidoreductase [Desulfosarcina sp.]|nr:SDR family oxidoreductase [Desulfosarcina sp.]MBC2742834.1 SDR family oxidoreductase [Desulfosarcina sp.]MBC2765744.1 SDR family oxidoreductase [Desulfosarcina sp.]
MGKMLSGKTAVVTGSGKRSGIGYAVARKLAGEGANVVIADLGMSADPDLAVKTGGESEMAVIAQELARTHGVETIAVNLDVTRADSITQMVNTISERFDRIHILVNNAGASFGVPNAVHTYDETAWMKTIDVNLHGVFRVSRALLPMMILDGGAIINTASRAGKVPALFNGAYAVAKAGVIMLTKVMASELAGNDVRVNAICPGQIATDLEKWRFGLEAQFFGSTIEEREKEMCKTIPLGRIGSPDEVGNLVVFLASDRASYMTGQAINITGGQLMEL